MLRGNPSNAQFDCPLFKLPPEIRNQIWELAFTTPSSVDFVDACPLSKALIMTCQRIHEETKRMYTHAARAYWSDTQFVVDVLEGDWEDVEASEMGGKGGVWDQKKKAAVYANLQELRDEDVAHMKDVWMPTSKSGFHVFGDPQSDMWAYRYTIPDGTDCKTVFLCAPIEKQAALRESGLNIDMYQEDGKYMRFAIHMWEWDDVVRAREIIKSPGLSKDELMTVIRLKCEDKPRISYRW